MKQSNEEVCNIIDENITRIDDIPEDKVECCICGDLFSRNYMSEDKRGYVCRDCIVARKE